MSLLGKYAVSWSQLHRTTAHWKNPKWKYHTAASHDDARKFHKRQAERMKEARRAV